MAVAGKGLLTVDLVLLAPADDGAGVHLVLSGRLRQGLAGLQLAQHLQFEVLAELASLQTHEWLLSLRIPFVNSVSHFRGAVHVVCWSEDDISGSGYTDAFATGMP